MKKMRKKRKFLIWKRENLMMKLVLIFNMNLLKMIWIQMTSLEWLALIKEKEEDKFYAQR